MRFILFLEVMDLFNKVPMIFSRCFKSKTSWKRGSKRKTHQLRFVATTVARFWGISDNTSSIVFPLISEEKK
jgi:hypothetical protein